MRVGCDSLAVAAAALSGRRVWCSVAGMSKSLFASGVIFLAGAMTGATAMAAGQAGASAPAAGGLAGKVVETMNAASYTYVQIDTGAKKVWAAAPQFAVKVGDRVVVADAMPMNNYQSKTLNRTFDVVYFSGNISVNGATPGAAAPAAGAAELSKGHPPMTGAGAMAAASAGPDLKNIKRADGGQTVEEIVKGKAKFGGKPIAVRGRVVKFNRAILGKNWLHIRDGSGGEGTNDLTVTTQATVKVGDLVVVTGTLSVDKDFGSGYKYGLIVEDAKVTVE